MGGRYFKSCGVVFEFGPCKYAGFPGYFVDEIMVVNIRDFDISFLIDLGDYTCSLA